MIQQYDYGMWVIAAINIGLFLFFFLSFLSPMGKFEWRNMGLITAFIVALFSEMYGFPLTIYLLTGWLGDTYPVLQPFNHMYGHLWVVVLGGSNLAWVLIMAASLILMLAGYVLLSKGWRQVHTARGDIVNDGVYAFARHPQYTGLFLVIAGFLVQWPTLLTLLMAPVLFYAYVKLANSEERLMIRRFGDTYDQYRNSVPAFFPSPKKWRDFLTADVMPVKEHISDL